MDNSTQDGQDSSPIKPVSSLRSHFENMNKSSEPAHPTLPRSISPARKPLNLRDAKPQASGQRESSPAPPPLPKSRPVSTLRLPTSDEHSERPSARALPAPPSSPKPLRPPPSVTVQPPQSPPKGRLSQLNLAEQSSFLNPDSLVTPVTPSSASPRHFKIPSRPHTPSVEARNLQRPASSNPPSPPPPRRSGDLKRDTKPPPPPPVNRAEKPSVKARLSYFGGLRQNGDNGDSTPGIAQETSPFSSPPSSPSSTDEETPPPMPARPRPPEAPKQAKAIPLDFEPPPVHPSTAMRRLERESEGRGGIRGHGSGVQSAEHQPPSLPSRPHHSTEPAPRPPPINSATRPPPPQPPRPGLITKGPSMDTSNLPASKRVVSTPTAQQSPLSTKGVTRSLTVDRPSDRRPPESRPGVALRGETGAPYHEPGASKSEGPGQVTAYPDASNTNRRAPFIKGATHEIHTKYDAKIFDVCGQYACCVGHLTRVWRLLDGELMMSLPHPEGVKATAAIFKPGANADEEGMRLWIGTNFGEVMEVDIHSQSVVCSKPGAHGRYEVCKIYRHYNELWTLDDGGTLHVWGADEYGVPNLNGHPHQTYRVPKNHTFSMVVGDELWHSTGKDIRVFLPTSSGKGQFQVLLRPLVQDSAGEVTAGTLLRTDPDKVFFGHTDGKITIYSRGDYSCLGLLNISSYKINSLAGVGQDIWAGYNNGRICVYDMGTTPWAVKKDWQAHDNPVVRLLADPASVYRIDRKQVISLGADNRLRIWDGFLQEDWLESEMKAADAKYCRFGDLRAMIMTWNAGASTPHSLRYSDSDSTFIQHLLESSDAPDILVFGFQELVDLEDKTATAKRFLKGKKKDKKDSDQERMSHQYRDWRDFLLKSLDDFMPRDYLYHLLQTSHMVGLFTCIFVKSTIRDRIRNLNSAEVKRGLGGLHGNKGAVVIRFTVDDTSLCFVNCHLAAGQSQANARHSDIAAILEEPVFPSERDHDIRMDSYVGGGDGTMILDHELCLLNGDLNYRIDTMSRDTVVMAVKANNLGKLLERDQLLVARRRNPAFRLRAFEEMPITFAPTYKYDVGTDNYDTSEKKRSPAWCDRILYRGRGRIQQLDYRRHEVRVSDHRPVTARFKFVVKSVDTRRRAATWNDCQQRLEDVKQRESHDENMAYLMDICGYDEGTSRHLIREKAARRTYRSPSRHRD